jgi:hypothetical protein
MSSLIEQWVKNPWFQLSGFAIGVVGLAIAIVIYALSRRYKRIWYDVRSFALVERERSTVPGLEVTFEKKPVDALTISKACIWNSGNEALRYGDFAPTQRLLIEVGNKVQILEASIVQTSSKNCQCELERAGGNSYAIKFDFLDPSDGLVVQIAHTGAASKDVNVTGHIVGGGKISRPRPLEFLRPIKSVLPKSRSRRRIFSIWFLGLAGVFMIVSGWMAHAQAPSAPSVFPRIVFWVFGIFYLVSAWSIYRIQPPKGLERYDDELHGSDFKGHFKFAEAPQFSSRREAAEWLISQAQALAANSHTKFKATIVSDTQIKLVLEPNFWLTMWQIRDIVVLGEKHGFTISISGSGENPLIPREWYRGSS